jgi:hypothetical protein
VEAVDHGGIPVCQGTHVHRQQQLRAGHHHDWSSALTLAP